jgi:hypothetical protein
MERVRVGFNEGRPRSSIAFVVPHISVEKLRTISYVFVGAPEAPGTEVDTIGRTRVPLNTPAKVPSEACGEGCAVVAPEPVENKATD